VTGRYVVVITRAANGEQRAVEWFEDETRFYSGDPFRRVVFNPVTCVWTGRTVRVCTVPDANVEAAVTLWRLTRNPWCDVSDVATHEAPEPGAPLEPIEPAAVVERPLGGAA
jgi:hypothetical protein